MPVSDFKTLNIKLFLLGNLLSCVEQVHQRTDLLHGEIREEYLFPMARALQQGGHERAQAGHHRSVAFHSQSLGRHQTQVSYITLVDQHKIPIKND